MVLIDILRSFLFCFKHLPFTQAVKLPVLITSNVGKIDIKGRILLQADPVKRYQVIIGRSGSEALQSFKAGIYVKKGGCLKFGGSAVIGEGTVLRVDEDANLEIGDRFYCNKNCYIRCSKSIQIGSRVTFGWNNTLNDTDGHTISYEGGEKHNNCGCIRIGEHVWITTNCFINKDAAIPDESVVALGSVVNRLNAKPHTLIGGVPAKVLKEGIHWQE